MSNANNNQAGMSFMGFLALLFIGLKLTGNLDWSWWWVLAPIWGPLAVAAIVFVSVLMGGVVLISAVEVVNWRKRKR